MMLPEIIGCFHEQSMVRFKNRATALQNYLRFITSKGVIPFRLQTPKEAKHRQENQQD